MSKMSAVHQDLHELGYQKVYQLEQLIKHMLTMRYSESQIKMSLKMNHHIDNNTLTMIFAGANEHKCSKMLADERSLGEYY